MRSLPLCLLAAAGLALCACSGSSPATPSPSGNTPMTILITGQKGAQSFSPNPASAGGQTVVFKNNDSVTHRVRLNDGSLDTGDIPPGGTSRALMMPQDGTNYHCSLHTTMIGSVFPASGGSPPTCQGQYC